MGLSLRDGRNARDGDFRAIEGHYRSRFIMIIMG